MSFIHYTYVGHFDPATVGSRNLAVAKPIDPVRIARLLAEYPAGVAERVALQDGYARCQWAPGGGSMDAVIEFAYRLARKEGCLAVEQGREVMYPLAAARAQGEALERATGRVGLAAEVEQRAQAQCDHLREIIGDPFRPVAFSTEWRTDTAVSLARQMYESRDFSAMPILADALQDAGCDEELILSHCRDTSLTHVRGCWVVDLVLNRE
jgi:hypothetical protein